MDSTSIIIICFIAIILRYIIIEYAPDIIVNAYLFIGMLGAVLTYTYTNDIRLALFVALILIYVRTLYRYNVSPEDITPENSTSLQNTSLFAAGLVGIFAIVEYKKYITPYIALPTFIMIMYGIMSIGELSYHRYVMHCTNSPILQPLIESIPYLNKSCKKHIEHHVDVEPTMDIYHEENDTSHDSKLFMGWNLFIPIFLATIVAALAAKYLSTYNISIISIIIISIIITIAWEFLWNKTHKAMHNMKLPYSIKKGPYDNDMLDMNFVKNMLYENHKNHHLQKGPEKGNYNVILLGADEWLGINVKTVDNSTYCKTHKQEKICHDIN